MYIESPKKITVMIQARIDSKRLPKKVLKLIQKKPLIWYVINRIKKIRGIDQIILVTSNDKSDKILLNIAKKNKIHGFAGNKNNVLNRFYECAKEFSADPIIRITGDCPLIDPKIISKILRQFLNNNYDYMTNTHPPTFPDGLDVEIFSFQTLQRVNKMAKLRSEKEHVTPYIKNHPKQFKIFNVLHPVDLSHLRWTVDEINDLKFIRKIFSEFKPNTNFSTSDILKLLNKKPKLKTINSNIYRNSGYLSSLKNDKV